MSSTSNFKTSPAGVFFFFLMKAQPIATLIAAAITKATGKLR